MRVSLDHRQACSRRAVTVASIYATARMRHAFTRRPEMIMLALGTLISARTKPRARPRARSWLARSNSLVSGSARLLVNL
jgi:hypothetical protein